MYLALSPAVQFKKSFRLPVHPERICWGCDKYCPADDLACGNGTVRALHPIEIFGEDWERWADERTETEPMQRITEYLTADHARLHALLERACAGASLDLEAFEGFRAGLLRHIGIEEKVLFPAVRAARGEPLASARALRVEHGAIASLLVPTPDLALARELAGLLARHDATEEDAGGVYEQCERALGEDRSHALASHHTRPLARQ